MRPSWNILVFALRTSPMLCAFFFAGCTKPPKRPELSRDTVSVAAIALSDRLRVEDVRKIYRALNKNGRLDSLQPFFDRASEPRVEKLVAALDGQVFQTALEKTGFLARLGFHIEHRTFSELHRVAGKTVTEPHYDDIGRLILHVAEQPSVPLLAARASGWIHPTWSEIVQDARERVKAEAPLFEREEVLTLPQSEAIVQDVRRVLNQKDLVKKWDAWFLEAARAGFFGGIVQALGALRGQLGRDAFRGLGAGISRMLAEPLLATAPGTPENRLDQLLFLIRNLDSPSAGLFVSVQESFRKPGLLDQLAPLLEPTLAQSIFLGFQQRLREREGGFPDIGPEWTAYLKDPRGTWFQDLASLARTSMEIVTGVPQAPAVAAEKKFRESLHALALARWVRAAAENRLGKKAIPKFEWIPFETKADGSVSPTEETARDLKALNWSDEFSTALKNPAFSKTAKALEYRIPAFSAAIPFEKALARAVTECGATWEFMDRAAYTAFLNAQIVQLTTALPGKKTAFEQLESPNLLAKLQDSLVLMSPEVWSGLSDFLFESVQLGQLPEATRQLFLSWFANDPKLTAKVESLFDSAQALRELDTGSDGLLAPFASYHAVIQQLSGPQRRVLGRLFSLLSESRFLSGKAPDYTYPAIAKGFEGPGLLADSTFFLSHVPLDSISAFAGPIDSLFKPDRHGGGFLQFSALVETLLERFPKGSTELVRRWDKPFESSFKLESLDREWLAKLLQSSDFESLWDFFSSQFDRARMLRMVGQLQALTRSGELVESVRLLAFIENERMKRVGVAWVRWIESGEWGAFLNTVETLLKPLSSS